MRKTYSLDGLNPPKLTYLCFTFISKCSQRPSTIIAKYQASITPTHVN